jgi:glutamate--cysteine ligase
MSGAGSISEEEAEAHVHGICFKTGPPRRTGVELEWLVHDGRDPQRAVSPGRIAAAVADLRGLTLRSSLTQEPGGQLELSSPPAGSLTECVETVAADLAAVRERLDIHRLKLAGHGHDPWHGPRRLLELPRYNAMEEYFDRAWPAGRSMMCSTASVQVCLDAGTATAGPDGYVGRWRLAHLLGPVLVAAFANSPLSRGRPTGMRCTRQAVWAALEPARTLAPGDAEDPRDAWTRYALDATVLCLRGEGQRWTAPAGLTFRRWIRERRPRPPTLDDLAYHLTTLFPPVRPQGHLEFRMIDAQPGDDGWIVPLAVTAALLDDPAAGQAARRAVLPLAAWTRQPAPRNTAWRRATRCGLADPVLRTAAAGCFAAAQEALSRLDASTRIREAVAAFADRYVDRGRCPADDLLEGSGRRPALVPAHRNVTATGREARP